MERFYHKVPGANIYAEEVDGQIVIQIFQDNPTEGKSAKVEVIDIGGSHVGEFGVDNGDPDCDRWIRWS